MLTVMSSDPALTSAKRLDLLREAREHNVKSLALFNALNEVKGGAGRYNDTISELEADIAEFDEQISSPQ